MSFSPCFVSFINENDTPILIYVPKNKEEDINDTLKYNVFSNISIDYFSSTLYRSMLLETHPEIKELFHLEGVTVYGTILNSVGLKIIIGSKVTVKKDEEIKETFDKIKSIYLTIKSNPFIQADNDNQSKTFADNLSRKLMQELDNQ